MDFATAMTAFTAALDATLAQVNEKMSMPDYYAPVTLESGSKNIRVVSAARGSRSVYCFIRKSDGAILKAAGWKAPAKGERGNIFNPDTYKNLDAYGQWMYLR